MKAIVVKAKKYDFDDKNSGKVLKGTSIQYIAKNPEGELVIGKTTGSLDDVFKFKEIPAVYDIAFDYFPDSKGKLVGHFRDAKFVEKAVINL